MQEAKSNEVRGENPRKRGEKMNQHNPIRSIQFETEENV